MINTSVTAFAMIWDNILIVMTVLGLGGSASGALGPTQTVAPWYRNMQIQSEGASDPQKVSFLFAIKMIHVSRCI